MGEGIRKQRLRSLPFLVAELDAGILLKRGTTELLIQGETALETVLLILANTTGKGHPREKIADQFPASDRDDILALLDEMTAKRLLVRTQDMPSDDLIAETQEDVFYWTADTARTEVIRVLSGLHLVIAGVNRITHHIYRSLDEMGVRNLTVVDDPVLRNPEFFDHKGRQVVSFGAGKHKMRVLDSMESATNSRCAIAASEFGGSSFLLHLNEACIRRKMHFMPVFLKDMIGYAGPLVIPGETACLHCLMLRQNAHLQNSQTLIQIEREMRRGQSIAAIHPAMISILAETVVFEICHFYGALPEPRPGRLVIVNLPGGTTESKRVLKVPRCPVCSTLAPASAVQIRKLSPLPK